ncbi:MAG TPA: hypothetical protein VGN07_16025 [Steroidobacteraceae bacterium]
MIVVVIAAAFYCGTDQMREVYRVGAEGEHPAQLIFAVLTELLTLICLWSAARRVSSMLLPDAHAAATWEGFIVRWIPRLCAAAVLFFLGLGLWQVSQATRLEAIPPVLTQHSASLARAQHAIEQMARTSARLEVAAILVWVLALALLLAAPRVSHRVKRRLNTFLLPPVIVGRWVAGSAMALIVLSLALTLWSQLPTFLGTLCLVNLFLAWLSLCLTGLFLAFDANRIPAASLLLAASLLFSWTGLNNNHLIHRTALKAPRQLWDEGGPQRYFDDWLLSRRDLDHFRSSGEPYPVIVVAARGGGLYASAQTATFLARLQDHCPTFSQHVFAVSSVSGGSLGAAAFAAYAKQHVKNEPWKPCTWGPDTTGPAETAIGQFLRRDFLAPLIGGTLFPDLLQRFLFFPVPSFDRARAFERGIETNWAAVDPAPTNPFTELFLDLADSHGAVPALLINTTEVETGRRRTISPFSLDAQAPNMAAWFYDDAGLAPFYQERVANGDRPSVTSDITLSTAVSLSARFPYILPAATLKQGRGAVHLVDGGYFDNSGIDTAQNLVESLANVRYTDRRYSGDLSPDDPRLHFTLYLIILRGVSDDYTSEPGPLGRSTAEEFASPIAALLSARTARGENTAYRVENARNLSVVSGVAPLYQVIEPAILDHQLFQLSLGFQLSDSALTLISAQINSGSECGAMNDLPEAVVNSFYPNQVPNRSGSIRDLTRGNSCQQCITMDVVDPAVRPSCHLPPPEEPYGKDAGDKLPSN